MAEGLNISLICEIAFPIEDAGGRMIMIMRIIMIIGGIN